MNRQLKFRAYSKDTGAMYYGISLLSNSRMGEVDGETRMYFEMEDKNFITMEWSGLVDLKEVEIYEGDVVQWERQDPEWGITAIGYDVVIYDEGSFKFKHKYGTLAQWIKTVESFEIVGNIYQNKELLEKLGELY